MLKMNLLDVAVKIIVQTTVTKMRKIIWMSINS